MYRYCTAYVTLHRSNSLPFILLKGTGHNNVVSRRSATSFFLFSISSSASLNEVFQVVSRIARCSEAEALRRSVSYTLQYIIGSFKGFD